MSPDVAVNWIVGAAWIALFAVWVILAFRVNRAAKRQTASSRLVHLAVGVLAYFLLFKNHWPWPVLSLRVLPLGQPFEVGGAILTCAGVLLAIWARALLGRNWSASVTAKQGHRLVRAGPYRLVRHPIYSGLLLAVLGTAVVVGKLRAVAAFAGVALTYYAKSRLEERFMAGEFGPQYEEYRRHTHALVPFIF